MSKSNTTIDVYFNPELLDNFTIDDVSYDLQQKLNSVGVIDYAKVDNTNHAYFNVNLLNKLEVIEIIYEYYPEMLIFHSISPDRISEVNESIEEADYFKGYSLAIAILDDRAKTILEEHLKSHDIPNLKANDLDDKNIPFLFDTLYNEKVIDEKLHDDIIEIDKIRKKFIHRNLLDKISTADVTLIKQNIPKIKPSLEEIEKMYQNIINPSPKVIEDDDSEDGNLVS